MLDLENLLISVGYITLTSLLLKFTRRTLLSVLKLDNFQQNLLLEFLATFELVAVVYELGVVIGSHGMLIYALLMLIIFNYWGKEWGSATAAPHPHIMDLLTKRQGVKTVVGKILAQILAASLVYTFYVKPFWGFGYRSMHLDNVRASRCYTHLQVPVPLGILVEAVATFVFNMSLGIFGPKKYNYLSLPVILVSIIYTGMTYTGAYMNPVLASTIQWGCQGTPLQDHLLVYWVGPVLGCVAFSVFNKLKDSSILDKNSNKKLKRK